MHRLSYANVVATLALFLAIGGTGYAAAKITGGQIARGTITNNNIKDGTLRLADFKKSERSALKGKTGNTGPAGPAGPAGADGPAGPAGASAATGPSSAEVIIGAEVNSHSSGYLSSKASCPAGKLVVGGGGTAGGVAGTDLIGSSPLSDRSGWIARSYSSSGGSGVTAYAICAAP